MLDELDCATLTLKKILFFKDMKELGLNVEIIIKELQKNTICPEKKVLILYILKLYLMIRKNAILSLCF